MSSPSDTCLQLYYTLKFVRHVIVNVGLSDTEETMAPRGPTCSTKNAATDIEAQRETSAQGEGAEWATERLSDPVVATPLGTLRRPPPVLFLTRPHTVAVIPRRLCFPDDSSSGSEGPGDSLRASRSSDSVSDL